MIRAVIFDWGGVLQRTEDQAPRAELERKLGLSPGELERAVFESLPFREACLGKRSADEAWAAIVVSLGWPVERVDEFVERFFAGDRVDEKLVQLIHMLRAGGYRVGLLSNAPPGRASGASPAGRWGMDGLFDAQVFSYQVGALKPHPCTYRAILAALGVEAHEALFVDDSPANVEGAKAVGITAVRFVGTEALIRELSLRLPLDRICPGDWCVTRDSA